MKQFPEGFKRANEDSTINKREVSQNYIINGRLLSQAIVLLKSVKIDSTLSDPIEVRVGNPQGTILGPSFFITEI